MLITAAIIKTTRQSCNSVAAMAWHAAWQYSSTSHGMGLKAFTSLCFKFHKADYSSETPICKQQEVVSYGSQFYSH